MDVALGDLRAVVTGGGRGIGASVAERMAREGATVTVLDLAQERDTGATFVATDVTDEAQVHEAIERAVEVMGGIDVVVNCAGIVGPFGKPDAFSVEDWRRTLEVNLTGTFIVCREVLPRMARAGRGSIVNFASGSGTDNPPDRSAYNVSKAGVISLTQSVARDHHEAGVRINAVCPGRVNTDMTAAYESGVAELGHAASDPSEFWEPDEILDAIVFLASAAGGHLNGQFLRMTQVMDPSI